MTLGDKLSKLRKENNYTQEQLADKVGVTRQTIGLIEAGKYNPSISLCIEICRKMLYYINVP